jgi:hypothetical protein
MRHSFQRCCALVSFGLALPAVAQPSGGPYGPLAQNYAVPANAAHVYYVAPDGKSDGTGASLEQPATLESAIARVVTGDVIVLRGGTYRTGDLKLNQGITLQPYADEQPILKGSQVATKWEAQSNGLWRIAWSRLFPSRPDDWWRRNHEGTRTPLYLFNNDMVFVDGKPLKTVGWEGEVNESSFSIDYEKGQIYLGVDPTNRLVEITAFDSALTRTTKDVHGKSSDRKGPVIKGITFTQYAYRALEIEGKDPEGVSPEAEHGKDVIGTTLEHVTISHCSRVAGYFRGDQMVFRHCRISDTSTEGIYILASNDVLLEKNILLRNNVEGITGYYPAAVKIFNQCHRVTCRDNLVLDQPNSNGIWYDVGNIDGVFVNNWVQDALDGFFFEISKGAICAGNVFVNCDKGMRVLNSSGVRAYHNTFVNTVASFERTERSAVGDHFGWHPRTGPDVEERFGHAFAHNLLLADERFRKELLRFEQPAALRARLTQPQVSEFDDNLYVRRDLTASRPLIVWSPSAGQENLTLLKQPAEATALHANFETRSRSLNVDADSVVRSLELGHYEPISPLLRGTAGATLPAEIENALGWKNQTDHVPGAYPLR